MLKRERPTDDELEREREDGLTRIRLANVNLIARAVAEGVRFTLEGDSLQIAIGPPPASIYTQRMNHVRVDLDRSSDDIVRFEIEHIDRYLGEHAGPGSVLTELLPALRRLGVIEIPPQTPATTALRESLQELIAV